MSVHMWCVRGHVSVSMWGMREHACVISVQMVVGHQDIEEHRLEVANSRTSKIEQRWSGGRKREFDMI